MPSFPFAARSVVIFASLASVNHLAACAADQPPPRARTAALTHRPSPREASPAATAGSMTSMGDSTLEPAAIEASSSEDWPRAESLYRELARRQPRNAAAKHGLGVALLRQQKNEGAIAALEDSLRLADEAQTRLDLAATFAALDRYPSALPHLRKAVQLAPREPAAWTGLADALVKVDKPEGAADSLRESRKTCPGCVTNDGWNRVTDDAARALGAKADKQIAAGDAVGARKTADTALILRPGLPEAHLALGKLARAEGDDKAAASSFRKAVEALPDAKADPGAGARLELAALLIHDGDGAEAVKLAAQVVAARGDDGVALDTLGRACDVTRNVDCARRAYGKLVRLPTGDGRSKGAVDHARLRMKELKTRRR